MQSRLILPLIIIAIGAFAHADDGAVPPSPTDGPVTTGSAGLPGGLSDDDRQSLQTYVNQCQSASTHVGVCCGDSTGRSCHGYDASGRAAIHATAAQISGGATGGGITDATNAINQLGGSVVDAAKGITRACQAEKDNCAVVCGQYLARAKALVGCTDSDLRELKAAAGKCSAGQVVGGGHTGSPGGGVVVSNPPATPGYGGGVPDVSHEPGSADHSGSDNTVIVVHDGYGGSTTTEHNKDGSTSTVYQGANGKPVVAIENDYSKKKDDTPATATPTRQATQEPTPSKDDSAESSDSTPAPKKKSSDSGLMGAFASMSKSMSSVAPSAESDGSVPRNSYYGMPPVRLPTATPAPLPTAGPHESVGFRTHATNEHPLSGGPAPVGPVGGSAQPIVYTGPSVGQPNLAGQQAPGGGGGTHNAGGQFKAGSHFGSESGNLLAANQRPFVKNHLDTSAGSSGGYKGYSSGGKAQQGSNLSDYLPNGRLAPQANGLSVGGQSGTSRNPQILSQGKDVWQNMSMRLQYFCKIGRLYDCN